MCTLTWLRRPGGCTVFFNRDEKRTRLPAVPPEVKLIDGVQVLTPTDGNAGGSWLTVNEHGVVIAILNYYEADARLPDDGREHLSRGQLVLNLSSVPGLEAFTEEVSRLTAEAYRPFFLAAFDAAGEALLAKWDGEDLVVESLHEQRRPVTTSSFKTDEVLAARRSAFTKMEASVGISTESLRAYHHSRDPLGGAFSVTMTRDDAQTFCYSEIEVSSENVTFFYQPREMSLLDPPYSDGAAFGLKRV